LNPATLNTKLSKSVTSLLNILSALVLAVR